MATPARGTSFGHSAAMSIASRFVFASAIAFTLSTSAATTFAREFNVAQGHLLRLDAGARQLVIRTEQGSQLQCTVTGETRLVGGASLNALPAMTRLTVHYAKDEFEFVATQIEVHELPF
jgi:hypothetical protein